MPKNDVQQRAPCTCPGGQVATVFVPALIWPVGAAVFPASRLPLFVPCRYYLSQLLPPYQYTWEITLSATSPMMICAWRLNLQIAFPTQSVDYWKYTGRQATGEYSLDPVSVGEGFPTSILITY